MRARISPILLLFLLASVASAAELSPVNEIKSGVPFFSRAIAKVSQCKWRIPCYFERKLGAGSITAVTGTTLLSDLDTVLTNNNTYFDERKVDIASSTWPALTTAVNLASVGTLTSGALGSGFTTVVVARGGTGSTTLAANLVLLGNGTGNVSVVNGTGASGQFLTSNGAGAVPSWTTGTVDQTANYAWTGRHTFAAQFGVGTSTPSTGTVGIQDSLSVSGGITTGNFTATGTLTWGSAKVPYTAPGAQGTGGSALVNDGLGNLSWTESISVERARVRRTSSITHASSASSTKIAFDVEDFDPQSRHNTTDSRFIVGDDGWYEVQSQVQFASDSSVSNILLEIRVNGAATTTGVMNIPIAATTNTYQIYSFVHLLSGEYIETWGAITGATNFTFCGTSNRCWMYVKKVFD